MWCRVCHEHDCGIDHGDSRVRRKKHPPRKTTTLPEGVGRSKPTNSSKKTKAKKASSHTQLRLF